MWDSTTYKTYLAYATGAASPKIKRKFKKPASPFKKKALFAVDKLTNKHKKVPAKPERRNGIKLRYDVALLEEAQLKKALKRSKRETNIHQSGGSSGGADFKLKVPDELKVKSIDISKGTGLKPGVPDVFKGDSSKSEYKL
nr:hypothetical protein [Tanacetum cinerariifolium]